ncbi:MAG: CDP-diacylglycerol--glycerol-3-phosphate 3-phosphatidyltransferase [Syntrophobacterales bacterium]|jgi:cardiolipin synthase|nr:CDP-diacylglycerol--glycerol-3-phosphate 3-phosphatidyltransferase [Syntrophobacterales bacterium]
MASSKASLTIPNLITLLRILLTPLFIIFLIQGNYRKALLIFILAGVSDMADGLIARTWQQKSRLGSYLDPLADKLLMAASFVTLSIYHQIPSWLTVVVISRDVTLALGVLIFRLGDIPLVIKVTMAGKWTTTFQLVTVGFVLLSKIWPIPSLVLSVFFWVTGIFTSVSGIQYLYAGIKQMNVFQGNDAKEDGNG